MFRFLIAAAVAVSYAFPLRAAEAQAASAGAPVFYAQDDFVVSGFIENPERSRAMVHALLLAVTGQPDLARAWRSLVTPADRVGIKIATAGGRYFSSHHGVVEAIVSGLEMAGVPRDHIIIWDRNSDDLRTAGYLPSPYRCEVRAIDPPRGYDREAVIEGSVLGSLMWGDLRFIEKQRVPFGKFKDESDQVSTASHLARIVSREVTKIINVPVLSDERGCGIAGAIYNASIPNIDNSRRFLQTEGQITSSPAEVYADGIISPKCVLHIMDALVAQYAGGPAFSPNYAFAHQTIYASKDPVALDSFALRSIDKWRVQAKLPPLAKRGAWLRDAAAMGLGKFPDESDEPTLAHPVR